jgi:transporter family protein
MPQWLLYALLSALFAALTTIFAKAGLKNINADLATAVRTVFIVIISWAFVFMRGKAHEISLFTKSNWVFLTLSGIATAFSWLFYYRALQQGNTSAVNAIDKGSLLFVIILSFLFLKEPISPKLLVGACFILTGMIIIIWK